ncbi:MAG: hypothetical protein IT423_08300 [Pirellulaceae bacterium]|nr:hypothetical protein [Pirellulaceae bacterium]
MPMQSMVVQAQFAEAKDLPEVPDHVRAGKKSVDHAQPLLGSSSFVTHAYQTGAPQADSAPIIAGPVPALPLEQAPPESLLDVDIYGTGSGTGIPASTDEGVAANAAADEDQSGSLIDGLDFMPFTALGLSDRADSNHRSKGERTRATRSNASASIGDTDPPAQVAIHESFAPRTKAGSNSFQLSDDAGSNSSDQANEYAFSDQDNTDHQDVGPDDSGSAAEPVYQLAQSTLSDAEPIGLPGAPNHSRADEKTNTHQGPLLVKTEAFSVPALPSVPTALSTPTAFSTPPELPEPLANRSYNTQRPMSLSVGAAEQVSPGLLAASPVALPVTDSAAYTTADADDSTTKPAVPTASNTAANNTAANNTAANNKVSNTKVSNTAASQASVASSQADKTNVDETASPSDANKPSLQPTAQPAASEKRSLSDVNPIALNRPIVKAVKPAAVSNPAADSEMAPVILPSSFEEDGSLVAGESFARLAAKMHALVKRKYPESRISIKSDEEGLIVQGVAASEAEASKILSFVRKTSLCPVADRVSTTR